MWQLLMTEKNNKNTQGLCTLYITSVFKILFQFKETSWKSDVIHYEYGFSKKDNMNNQLAHFQIQCLDPTLKDWLMECTLICLILKDVSVSFSLISNFLWLTNPTTGSDHKI